MRRASAFFALALGACHRPPAPEAVLAEYAAHLRAGRIESAYALTTPAYRARRSLAHFALAVARQPTIPPRGLRRDEPETVVALRAPGVAPVVLVGAKALLSQDPLDVYPTDTPEATLRSFVRAVERRRPEHLRALLSAVLRERLGAEPSLAALDPVAARLRALLTPAAGAPPPLLDAGPTGLRLLLPEGFVGLVPTARGWLVNDLP